MVKAMGMGDIDREENGDDSWHVSGIGC